eukprot:1395386-Amphidinium_carterae.2
MSVTDSCCALMFGSICQYMLNINGKAGNVERVSTARLHHLNRLLWLCPQAHPQVLFQTMMLDYPRLCIAVTFYGRYVRIMRPRSMASNVQRYTAVRAGMLSGLPNPSHPDANTTESNRKRSEGGRERRTNTSLPWIERPIVFQCCPWYDKSKQQLPPSMSLDHQPQ